MNILLSNDDGFSALGINVLDEVLSEKHAVTVAAPDKEQSGKSHSMTIRGRVRITEYRERHFHVSGTPADCIIYSHRCSLFPTEPDLVIAGINHGYNLSADIVYSGTCAAARQASFYGMKAIALSAEDGCGRDTFEKAARFVLDNLDALSASIKPMTFLNINVPIAFNGEWEKAGIGFVRYLDDISVVEERGNVRELEINGCEFHRFPSLDAYRADYEICASGKAAITLVDVLPHTADMGGFIL